MSRITVPLPKVGGIEPSLLAKIDLELTEPTLGFLPSRCSGLGLFVYPHNLP